MNKLCKFSVLRYVPNENREEFINIGLVFHSPSDGFVDFKSTTNFSRVTAFDDEMEIDFLKLVLKGIEQEFTQDIIHGPSLKAVEDIYFLEKQTSIYANQLQFSPIRIIRTNNIQKDFENLFKTYVYFDAKKNKRISEREVKRIMNRVFEQSIPSSSLDKDYAFDLGTETVTIDYSYQSKNNDTIKFIKTLSFDYSSNRTKFATQIAKEWAWNYLKIEKLNEKSRINKKDLTTVIYAKNMDNNINAAIEILKENSDIISVDNEDGIEEFAKSIVNDIK